MPKDPDILMTLEFRGRKFSITYRDLGKTVNEYNINGECYDTDESIDISKSLKGKLRLDTEIHEALHACFPMIDERIVNTSATDITRFLWKLGYRLKA